MVVVIEWSAIPRQRPWRLNLHRQKFDAETHAIRNAARILTSSSKQFRLDKVEVCRSPQRSVRPMMPYGGRQVHHAEVVGCAIFATRNSLKSQVRQNLKSPFSKPLLLGLSLGRAMFAHVRQGAPQRRNTPVLENYPVRPFRWLRPSKMRCRSSRTAVPPSRKPNAQAHPPPAA